MPTTTQRKTEGKLPRHKVETIDRAQRQSRRVAECSTALDFVRAAETEILKHHNRSAAPDSSTLASLRTTVRLLEMELIDARRLEEAANEYAEAAIAALP